jgi:RNA polymerase sigma factor (sigma-70 family)
VGISVLALRYASLDALITDAQAAEADNSAAMNEIVERFEPLTLRIACRLATGSPNRDDVANAARVGLVQAVRGHRRDVMGFPAYARLTMRGAAWREVRRWKPNGGAITWVSLTAADALEEDGQHAVRDSEEIGLWGGGGAEYAVAALTERQQRLLVRRYVHGADLAEIAAEEAVSSSAVSQRLATIHRALATALAA